MGEGLSCPGILEHICLLPMSAQTVLLVFPVAAHTPPRKASSPPGTSLPSSLGADPLPIPLGQVFQKTGRGGGAGLREDLAPPLPICVKGQM